MKTIWKQALPSAPGEHIVKTKRGARVLSAALDAMGSLCLWLLVDDEERLEERDIIVVYTGDDVPPNIGPFVDTVVLRSGLVVHVFEAALFRAPVREPSPRG